MGFTNVFLNCLKKKSSEMSIEQKRGKFVSNIIRNSTKNNAS